MPSLSRIITDARERRRGRLAHIDYNARRCELVVVVGGIQHAAEQLLSDTNQRIRSLALIATKANQVNPGAAIDWPASTS